MRIQFFPSPELEAKLTSEAAVQGVSVSKPVLDALNQHYGLVGVNAEPYEQLQKEVLKEVGSYIFNPQNAGTEFDLNLASATYAQIPMTYASRPTTTRARIAKSFNRLVTKGYFNVERAMRKNGKPKRTANRATIYRVVQD